VGVIAVIGVAPGPRRGRVFFSGVLAVASVPAGPATRNLGIRFSAAGQVSLAWLAAYLPGRFGITPFGRCSGEHELVGGPRVR
jgi:hypothetical protein